MRVATESRHHYYSNLTDESKASSILDPKKKPAFSTDSAQTCH